MAAAVTPESQASTVPSAQVASDASFEVGERLGRWTVVRRFDDRTALAYDRPAGTAAIALHWPGATAADASHLAEPPRPERHPAWLPYTEVLPHEAGVVLIHPAIAGPSLWTFARRTEPSPTQIDALGRRIIAAVGAAHRSERLVGALHPRGIWLAGAGHSVVPFLVGVGLSEALPAPAQFVLQTVDEAFVAPEVRDGDPLSTEADRYALGAVLCLLATGRAPAAGLPTADRLEELPERLRDTITACLDPDPRARPLDVLYAWTGRRAMPTQAWSPTDLDRLDQLAPDVATSMADPRPQPPLPTPPRPARTGLLRWLFLGSLAFVGVLISAWLTYSR